MNLKIYEKFLKNCIFVSYSPNARGHIFTRIILSHEEDFYWNNAFNIWSQWDNLCKKPLDWPDNSKNNDLWTSIENTIVNAYTTIPFTVAPFFGKNSLQNIGDKEAIKNSFIKRVNKPLLLSFLKSNKKFVIPTHISVDRLIKDYPTNSIINLWANYEILIKEDRFHRFSSKSQKNYEKIESYWKPLDHVNVFNVPKDKFFSKNYDEFEDEYNKIIDKFNIRYPRYNKIRAFMLRYLERNKYYDKIDKETFDKYKFFSTQEVEGRKFSNWAKND